MYFNFGLKASPDMAVTLLEIARIFATKVPGKVDADVLQLLWKVSLFYYYYYFFLTSTGICNSDLLGIWLSADHRMLKSFHFCSPISF